MVVASVSLALFLAILPINLTAHAVNVDSASNNTVISLPFPSPYSFGDCAQSLIVYNSSLNRYSMFLLTYNLGELMSDPSCVQLSASLNVNSDKSMFNNITFKVRASGQYSSISSPNTTDRVVVASNLHLLRFNFYVGRTSYSVSECKLTDSAPFGGYLWANQSTSNVFTYSYGDIDTTEYHFVTNYTVGYNGTWWSPRVNSLVSYSFSSTDGGAILQFLDGIDTNVNLISNDVSDVNDKLSGTNSWLSMINGNIVFYCQEILDKLNDGNDYIPEETTSNADMSNYEQAEGALMDDNIDKLNNIEMPDLNTFNSGSQNNAFKFISSNIEFFSGMNGTGSVSKIATVLVVILGLGLASFIIGLSNRKKGG